MKNLKFGLMALGILSLSACATAVRPLEVSKSETGVVSRVEAATILSISSVAIKGERARRGFAAQRRANARRGVTLVVRVERNGETLAITQGDDIGLSINQQVWVQFSDRVRVIPR